VDIFRSLRSARHGLNYTEFLVGLCHQNEAENVMGHTIKSRSSRFYRHRFISLDSISVHASNCLSVCLPVCLSVCVDICSDMIDNDITKPVAYTLCLVSAFNIHAQRRINQPHNASTDVSLTVRHIARDVLVLT